MKEDIKAVLPETPSLLEHSSMLSVPAENEENVRYLLTQMPFELESLATFIKEEIEENDPSSGMLKLLPGQNHCDGFFVARLRRKEYSGERNERRYEIYDIAGTDNMDECSGREGVSGKTAL